MNVTEEMERIEGHAFSTMVNLASDFRTFLRILASQAEVAALSAKMQSAEVTLGVLRRLLELAGSPAEEPYEHPADAAMSGYLWLLSAKNQDYSTIAAETVFGCPRCWWARKMAEHVRDVSRFRSRAGFARRVLPAGEVGVDYTAHVSEAVVPIQTLVQITGRMHRAVPHRAGAGGVVIYPIAGSEWPDVFRNHGTQNRIAKVLAET